MFEKYRIRKNRFLPVLYRVMEGQEFGRILAEQVLKELCALLGDKVDFVLFVSAKNVENYVFSTFPEDEARYYLWNPEGKSTGDGRTRAEGRKALRFSLDLKGILSGAWILEVPDRTREEEISEYRDFVPMLRAFLYCCFLTEAYEEERLRDCFTGLPCDVGFEKELQDMDAGYLMSVRVCGGIISESLNASIKKAADWCRSVQPGKAYRIGPDVVCVLYHGDKAGAAAAMQELMHALPECSFLMEPLSGINKDSVYSRIRDWHGTDENEMSFLRCECAYPKLPMFQEEAI